jgi:hypothetical protein
MLTYLLLGNLQDLFCQTIRASLEVMGYEARIVANPLAHPLRFTWRLDTLSSASQLIWEDGTRLLDTEIAGVLVSVPRWIARDGWNPDDLAYVQRETHAALLAWLWSLNCPVVNRYPPALWHRPDAPLLFWQPWFAQCGLRALDSLVSNVEQDVRAFGAVFGDKAVYAPLTAEFRYRLDSYDQWDKLAPMQRLGPIHLTQAPAALHVACVVGPRVVWEGTPPPDVSRLEPALTRFSAMVGLAFVEITTTLVGDGPRVAAVNPYPRIEHFGLSARREIVAGLVQLLTGSSALHRRGPTTDSR